LHVPERYWFAPQDLFSHSSNQSCGANKYRSGSCSGRNNGFTCNTCNNVDCGAGKYRQGSCSGTNNGYTCHTCNKPSHNAEQWVSGTCGGTSNTYKVEECENKSCGANQYRSGTCNANTGKGFTCNACSNQSCDEGHVRVGTCSGTNNGWTCEPPMEWQLLLKQTKGTYLTDKQWACEAGHAVCSASPFDDNFSRINELKESGQSWATQGPNGNQFRFKLKWGSGSTQEWRQTSNPMTYKKSGCKEHCGVTGYQAIQTKSTDCYWGGLEYGGSPSLLDGSVNHGNWWYAVGSKQNYNNGIPGPCGDTESSVQFWVYY